VLGVAATPEQLRVTAASFVPAVGIETEVQDEVGPVTRAAVDFDHVGALAELAAECVLSRYSYGGRIPATTGIGNRPLVTTTTLQRIAGSTASQLADPEKWRQVDELIEEYDRTPGRKGLPGEVAERLGVSVRTAHRYIAAVRAQRAETIEVRFFRTNLEVK
jgi:hypothetical protein